MCKLELISEEDLVNSSRMCSDYQQNAFLLDQLLVTSLATIVEFCHELQNTENQEIGNMLVNGKNA